MKSKINKIAAILWIFMTMASCQDKTACLYKIREFSIHDSLSQHVRKFFLDSIQAWQQDSVEKFLAWEEYSHSIIDETVLFNSIKTRCLLICFSISKKEYKNGGVDQSDIFFGELQDGKWHFYTEGGFAVAALRDENNHQPYTVEQLRAILFKQLANWMYVDFNTCKVNDKEIDREFDPNKGGLYQKHQKFWKEHQEKKMRKQRQE